MPNPRVLSIVAVAALVLLVLGLRSYVSVPAGHAAVATLFGDVRPDPTSRVCTCR